ncbi:hypothetical protein OUZ56_018387 [Daphnia magna]|uniref:GMP synthase n=1 Tax=Daphnia magna TaxID=35525 RepID=A0ABQ9Z8P7_9CRUS|nr:hypothetical protein OUZ56_018387 [Daphnia magna]
MYHGNKMNSIVGAFSTEKESGSATPSASWENPLTPKRSGDTTVKVLGVIGLACSLCSDIFSCVILHQVMGPNNNARDEVFDFLMENAIEQEAQAIIPQNRWADIDNREGEVIRQSIRSQMRNNISMLRLICNRH